MTVMLAPTPTYDEIVFPDWVFPERLPPAETLSILHPILGRHKSRPIGVYLAARYDHLSLMQQYKHRLEQGGFVVTSRWVNGKHEAQEGWKYANSALCALEDYEDIHTCDWVVSFTEQPTAKSTRGGRHVELGIALALNKRCIVIGPRENVFHYLPQIVRYETWEDFYGQEIGG